MKKFFKNNLIFLIYFIYIFYLEIMFKVLTKSFTFNLSLLLSFIYSLFISAILSFITSLFKEKANKVLMYIFVSILWLLFCVELCVYKIFGFYFNLSLLRATDQVLEFSSTGIKLIFENILSIICLFIPIIFLIIFHKKLTIKQNKVYFALIYLLIAIIFLLGFNIVLKKNREEYHLLYEVNNTDLTIQKIGVLPAFISDVQKHLTNFQEKINVSIPHSEVIGNLAPEENPENPPEEINYDYNNLDIDFNALISKETNKNIIPMHEYFQNEPGTKQNKYTGFFENKNLILFMAESFNEIAVDKDLTPTLYKLVHNGFVFNNFYTPTISSTIGGEFQEITGLVAASGFLSPWREGTNTYPFGLATIFQKQGYNTYAYHNHNYAFQDRNVYLKSLGFTNFLGCFNGLEKRINCNTWPESDIDLIEATTSDYLSSDKPFMTYYVTVSGHGGYTYSGNYISSKNRDLVKDLPYSSSVQAYLATQIELDRALELLINKLDEAGKLDDTVIALVGDHYPYFLNIDEINEVSSYQKDSVVEVNRSNFILWNSKMSNVQVDKVGSQIDVLPTLYNLFGLNYDSRLIIGKDILSTEPGLAIFGDRSWVSDYGTYYAGSSKFISKNGQEVSDEYIYLMNNIVANKVNMSSYIMEYNYYKYFK